MRKIIHRIIKQKPSLLGEHIQHLLLAEPIWFSCVLYEWGVYSVPVLRWLHYEFGCI
jgi:hypothetical protein